MRQFRRSPSSRPPARIVRVESREVRSMGESRVRLILVASFFVLCFAMLGLRLLEVSTMGGGDLPFKRLVTEPQLLVSRDDDVDVSKIGEAQQIIRREIVDRNGLVLATSIKTASLVANPTIIRHEHEVAAGLARIFPNESVAAFEEKLMRKHATFLYLARHLTPGQQEAVNNLGVPGLFFETDIRRVYPYGGMFSHSLGYVGVDNQGLAGIEKYFDGALQAPQENGPLQLSLDLRIQSMLRDELGKAVREFQAIGGVGVVLDIASGEVLAMTSLPEFDPHQPGKASNDALFNRATLGVYEMGSTFKTFTLAAALENKVVSMKSGYDASRPLRMGNYTISDAHSEGRWLSVPEIFAYSSNVGTAKMALDLGSKRQRAFLQALGLFEPVALEVPELARPIVPHAWPELTTMTVAYGHGISVSPLHLINAIAALAGDGALHPLTLVKDGNRQRLERTRVISEKTIADVRDLLRLVVVHGTGKSANAPGYEVGGKTGTAEKNAHGVYDKNAKVASFVGVFPVSRPRYAILVMVDEPKGNAATYGFATGGWISAPVVGRVVQRMAPLLAMQPNFAPADGRVNSYWANAQARTKATQLTHENTLTKEAVRAASF
ncbi:MAG: penicillin-binding protein 2 [Alphaproteobacteria bacterium]|nr:penicillin-binding protein 2 [Alphaproteobacteria bacterium]